VKAGIDAQEYEHIEAGRLLPTAEQFRRLQAAQGDMPAERLYGSNLRQIVGVANYVGARRFMRNGDKPALRAATPCEERMTGV
jgi:hypothetical protein